jgi:ribose transport system permease protein
MNSRFGIKKVLRMKNASLAFTIIIVIFFFWYLNPNFLNLKNIVGLLDNTALVGTITVGMGCLLISGNIDLAAGAEGMMGGVLVALLLKTGMAWPLALVLVILFGALAGAFNAFLSNVLNFMPFIATLGMASVYQGLGYILSNHGNVSIANESFYNLGSARIVGIPLPFIIMLALFVVYGFILRRTGFGRSIYMCGDNKTAARLAGMNTKRISTILFINCGALSAFSGAVVSARMHIGAPGSIISSEMDAIPAAILGGTAFMGGSGSMSGCFLGLMLINIFKNGLNAIGVRAYWQVTVQGLLLLLALALEFFSKKERKRESTQTPNEVQ